MLLPLRALIGAVRLADTSASFFFTGDYVNRGPDSRGVIDLLRTLPNARFVRGNHDDVFDMILHGRSYYTHPDARNPSAAFNWFIHYGLRETLSSYGVEPGEIAQVARKPTDGGVRMLFDAVPAAHRWFIRSLPPVIEAEDFFIAHARWDPDDTDADPPILPRLQDSESLRRQIIWGRFTHELKRPKAWRRTGYFGHTPVQTYPSAVRQGDALPIRGPRIVLLDTGAAVASNGRLTAICIEDGRVIQVDRSGQLLESQ